MYIVKKILLSFIFLFSIAPLANDYGDSFVESENNNNSNNIFKKIKVGWYERIPFSYLSKGKIQGLDIDLVTQIGKKSLYEPEFIDVENWENGIKMLRNGEIDILPSAIPDAEKSNFSFFSEPYRDTENIFVFDSRDSYFAEVLNIVDIVQKAKMNDLKIGIIKEFKYVDKYLNDFIKSPEYRNIFVHFDDDFSMLKSLSSMEIHGFFANKISVEAALLSSHDYGYFLIFNIKSKQATSLMFSKKTISKETVMKFNKSIAEFVKSPDYNYIFDFNSIKR